MNKKTVLLLGLLLGFLCTVEVLWAASSVCPDLKGKYECDGEITKERWRSLTIEHSDEDAGRNRLVRVYTLEPAELLFNGKLNSYGSGTADECRADGKNHFLSKEKREGMVFRISYRGMCKSVADSKKLELVQLIEVKSEEKNLNSNNAYLFYLDSNNDLVIANDVTYEGPGAPEPKHTVSVCKRQ
ncbi:MAG: hypothetical protein HY843_05470 [Bdellovibrio sp.]|nr:hypothetical protein [Bdellovibrio sp.]